MKNAEDKKELEKEQLAQGAPESLSDDELDNVAGGAFEKIPRVPVKQIDPSLKGKV